MTVKEVPGKTEVYVTANSERGKATEREEDAPRGISTTVPCVIDVIAIIMSLSGQSGLPYLA